MKEDKIKTAMQSGEKGVIIQKDESGVVKMPAHRTAVVDVVTKQELEVKRLAAEIIEGTVKVGEKYLSLCQFIRLNKVEKSNATKWLLDMGFSKPRASEVCRISYAADSVWSDFAAKSIGWRGALQLTRGNIEEMRKVNPAIVPAELAKEAEAELVQDEESKQDELEKKYAGLSETEKAKKIEEDKVSSKKIAASKAAIKILKIAKELGYGKKFTFPTLPDNHYVLTLTFNPQKGKVEVPRT